MKQTKYLFIIACCVVLISACGGGGGSGGSGGDEPKATKVWGTAELIESNDGDVGSLQLASDDQGMVITAWLQDDGTTFNLWVNLYNGSTWEGAQLIETDVSTSLQLACDRDGNAIILFYRNSNIWATYFDGTSWGSAELIENGGSFSSQSIAFDEAGNAIAVWSRNNEVWAIRFNGTSWEVPVMLSGINSDINSYAVVALDKSGIAMAVWKRTVLDVLSSTRLESAMFDGQNWSAPEYVTIHDAGVTDWPKQPYIAFDGLGHATIIWINKDGGGKTYIWSSRHNGTNWEPVQDHHTGLETEYGYRSLAPQIGFDSTGKGYAIWSGEDSAYISDNYIFGEQFDGISWKGPEEIEMWPNDQDNTSTPPNPDLSVDSFGNAYLTWRHATSAGWDIYARWFDGVTLSDAERYETDDQTISEIKIVFDGLSKSIVVWVQSDGIRRNVWANTFE